MDSKKAFGIALRKFRKARKLTQEDFGTISSRTYLSTLERGVKSPTLDKIEALATALNVHPLSLLVAAYTERDQLEQNVIFQRIRNEMDELEHD